MDHQITDAGAAEILDSRGQLTIEVCLEVDRRIVGAAARAFAAYAGMLLYRWLPSLGTVRLPVPHFNVANGGLHAKSRLDFQELMVARVGDFSLPEALRAGSEVYACVRDTITRVGCTTDLGDEGGFVPALRAPEDVFDQLVETIAAAGYQAVTRCYRGGFGGVVSQRSGETSEAFIADLAVAIGCGQMMAGALACGERVAKHNRLLAIEAEDRDLPYSPRHP